MYFLKLLFEAEMVLVFLFDMQQLENFMVERCITIKMTGSRKKGEINMR